MFTQREFLWLDDLLQHEQLEVKHCLDAAQRCSDPQLQQLLTSLAQRHQQHFDQLLSHLNRQAQGQQPSQTQSSFQAQTYSQPQAYAQPYGTAYGGSQQQTGGQAQPFYQ